MGEVSNAENAATTMIENIMDEVISITAKRTDSCPTAFDDSKFQTLPNKDAPSPVLGGIKEGILENVKVLDEHEHFSLHPRLSERFCLSLTNLPEVWEHGSTFSTSTSQQGEGDIQQQSMLEATTFYQLELLNQNWSALNRDQNRKSLSTSSLSTDVAQNKVLKYLESSFQNLTFDTVQDDKSESSLQNLTFDTAQFTRNSESSDDENLESSVQNLTFDRAQIIRNAERSIVDENLESSVQNLTFDRAQIIRNAESSIVDENLESSLQNLTFERAQFTRNAESSIDENSESSLKNLTFDTVQFTRNTYSSRDNDDNFTDYELVDDEKNFPSESTSPREHTESLLLSQQYLRENWDDAEESSDSAEYIFDSKNMFLRNSQKFYQNNNVEYFPASFEQLSDNYCELVDDTFQMETKYNEGTEEVLSENSKELVTVENGTEMVDSIKNLPPTNPFRYPHVQPSVMDLSSTFDNSSPQIDVKESTTGIRTFHKGSDWEESNDEVQTKVTKPENFIDIEENLEEDNVDIIQSRDWSSTFDNSSPQIDVKESTTGIRTPHKGSDWEESNEVQTKVTEPESFIDIEENLEECDVDIIQSRGWSSTFDNFTSPLIDFKESTTGIRTPQKGSDWEESNDEVQTKVTEPESFIDKEENLEECDVDIIQSREWSSTFDNSNPQINFKQSTTAGVRPTQKGSDEVPTKVTEPEQFIDIEENIEEDDVDVIQTREYWSNTGLMTEQKINPKYLGPLPDVTGIESIKGVLSVKETCLEQNAEENSLLRIPIKHDENNSTESPDHNDNARENFLSYPVKAENKKRKKTVINRLTNTISHIFRSKKSYSVENKK